MGYDLHITRREHWADAGDDISGDEWLTVVATDPELQLQVENGPYFAVWSQHSSEGDHWLSWSDGQIDTKNPTNALIDKMVEIARELGAEVQGDDGEIYTSSTHLPRVERISAFRLFLRRLHHFYSRFFGRPKLPPPPFGVGDRVIDLGGGLGTVKSINRRANLGYGELRVVMDDGGERIHMLFAHGFSKFEGE